ncbi:MAG: hypothetical protein AB2606_02585 [Candidatus Thiodiazotropha taylori]
MDHLILKDTSDGRGSQSKIDNLRNGMPEWIWMVLALILFGGAWPHPTPCFGGGAFSNLYLLLGYLFLSHISR